MIFFLHLMTTQHSRKATNKVKEQGKKHIKALKKINRVVGVTQQQYNKKMKTVKNYFK